MNLSPLPIQKFFGNNGRPLDGGLLFTYAAGTSNKIATHKDSAGTLNTNPIVLDFRGECRLWIDPLLSYKFILSPEGDSDPPTKPIWTVDDITAAPAQADNAAVDTGSVNNIVLAIPQISSPVAFTRIVFKAANTNTGPSTISINGGPAKDLTWQSLSEFTGSEIQANGLYEAIYDGAQWQLQGPTLQPGNVLLYGADPTGSTASDAAFADAIAALSDEGPDHTEASKIGGKIIVPAGLYLLNSTVTIGKDQVEIEGDQYGQTVIRTEGAFPAFTVDSDTLVKIYGATFRSLRFTSTVTNRAAGSAAIKFVAAENFTVENCIFHLVTKYGVWMVDSITGRIINNQFDSGDWQNQGMDIAIFGESSNDVTVASGTNATVVTDNTVRYTVTAGLSLRGNPIHDPPTSIRRECSGVVVQGNHFEHNFGDAIQLLRNRAWFIEGNWFEDNGTDAASGRGHIMDVSTDDNEATTPGANSGLNAALSIRVNTFGGHDNANVDFQHIGLKFTVASLIEENYFTAGVIGLTADCQGLTIRDNWSSQGEPTLAGTLPSRRLVRDNFNGPAVGVATASRWIGSFFSFDGTQTPVAITGTSDTTPSLLDSSVGRVNTFVLAASGALTITQFDDAQHGDVLYLVWANGNTTLQNTTGDNGINLRGQANFTGATKDTLTLIFISGGSSGFTNRWFEIDRCITTPQTYVATNVTTDRAYDADTVVVAELADVVGTLIADLRSAGIVK